MIALAANILIRAVMVLRVPQPLETYAVQGVRFCPPDAAFAEAVKYLPALLRKNGKPETGLSVALSYCKFFSSLFSGKLMTRSKRARGNACEAGMKMIGR